MGQQLNKRQSSAFIRPTIDFTSSSLHEKHIKLSITYFTNNSHRFDTYSKYHTRLNPHQFIIFFSFIPNLEVKKKQQNVVKGGIEKKNTQEKNLKQMKYCGNKIYINKHPEMPPYKWFL